MQDFGYLWDTYPGLPLLPIAVELRNNHIEQDYIKNVLIA